MLEDVLAGLACRSVWVQFGRVALSAMLVVLATGAVRDETDTLLTGLVVLLEPRMRLTFGTLFRRVTGQTMGQGLATGQAVRMVLSQIVPLITLLTLFDRLAVVAVQDCLLAQHALFGVVDDILGLALETGGLGETGLAVLHEL